MKLLASESHVCNLIKFTNLLKTTKIWLQKNKKPYKRDYIIMKKALRNKHAYTYHEEYIKLKASERTNNPVPCSISHPNRKIGYSSSRSQWTPHHVSTIFQAFKSRLIYKSHVQCSRPPIPVSFCRSSIYTLNPSRLPSINMVKPSDSSRYIIWYYA